MSAKKIHPLNARIALLTIAVCLLGVAGSQLVSKGGNTNQSEKEKFQFADMKNLLVPRVDLTEIQRHTLVNLESLSD